MFANQLMKRMQTSLDLATVYSSSVVEGSCRPRAQNCLQLIILATCMLEQRLIANVTDELVRCLQMENDDVVLLLLTERCAVITDDIERSAGGQTMV